MLIVILVLIGLCYFLPGILLHVRLRSSGLTLPVCLGLGLAGLIVLDVGMASLVGYRFPLQLGMNGVVIAGLAVWARCDFSDWLTWLKAQWPWPALGWGAVAAIFIVPAFVVPLPFDTDAQGFGLLALTVRLSGSLTSLAPFWPEIQYFYSPGFFLLAAQLADMAGGPSMPVVLLGLGHALSVATVAGIYAVAREFGDERQGAWAAIFAVLGYALFSTLMDSAYTNVLGNYLTPAILVLVFRAAQEPNRTRVGLAAGALASLPLAHPDSIIHLLMAYLPFYATIWLAKEKPTRRQYFTLTAIVPGVALAFCLPWILKMLPLVGGINVHERQSPDLDYSVALLWLNGWLPPLLALVGLGIAVWRRRWFDIWLVGWIVMILEISSLGNLDALSRRTVADPMQIFYPFGVAWHATIIPVPILAAMAVCALPPLRRWTPPLAWRVAVGAGLAGLALVAGLLSDPIIRASKGRVHIVGTLSSEADQQAMVWLREHTPPDTFILNYPGIEGDWAPVIAERKTVQFREQLFYIGADEAWALQESLRTAYLDPAAPDSESRIRAAGIDYILVPQVSGRPESFPELMRWRPPFIEPVRSPFAQATYLELVQDFAGAQIWRVKP